MKHNHFWAAMYLRLSRDDGDVKNGSVKSESNSIGTQREMIRDYIREQKDIELYDIYIDDGFSGSNFERPEFKRMIRDVEAGKVNCVIVKDLSRFGRDYIESGRYIQKVFPSLGVRFIALTDHYDSFHADAGESGIVLPVKNFINDSYCRDISTKVKSQFEIKRKNGECIAPFVPYGYQKDRDDKSKLVIDVYAAGVVKKIFEWKMEGMAISAIAHKLNELGILSPREYKKFIGCNYKGGFSGALKSSWSNVTIKRILTNEMYLGHLIQGKTEKINYKLKKSVEKPKEEWVKVENTHEPIVLENDFLVVQNLLKTDSRISPVTEKPGFFAGMIFCGDCGEQMIRRLNRYKDTKRVYYICSTKNRGDGCTRHSIQEDRLKELITEATQIYANCFLDEKRVFEKPMGLETNCDAIARYDKEIARLKEEQEKYYSLCAGVHENLKQGIITNDEFERLQNVFRENAIIVEKAQEKQERMRNEASGNGIIFEERLKRMQNGSGLKEIDRHTMCSMVKEIVIYENHRVEIEFYYMDQYRIMMGGIVGGKVGTK